MEQEITMKTNISSHDSKFVWTIENATKPSKLLLSEKFSLYPKCKTKLQGAFKIVKRCMNSLTLIMGFKRIDRYKDDITCITSLRMCDSRGKMYFRRCAKFPMSSKTGKIHWCISGRFSNSQNPNEKSSKAKRRKTSASSSDERSWVTESVISSDYADEDVSYLQNDVLVVKGSIKIYGCCIVSDSKTAVSNLKEDRMAEESVHETINDLKLAYESNLFTDVILKVDCFELRAHKFVLCARCPYLRRIICSDRNIVDINIVDMDKRVLEAFLRFLYTGVVGVVQLDIIRKLYSIADKYEVDFLKKNCSLVIKLQVNTLNACDFLILANEHKDAYLKRYVVNFITDHFNDAEISHNFSTIVKNHSELTAEVMNYKSLKRH